MFKTILLELNNHVLKIIVIKLWLIALKIYNIFKKINGNIWKDSFYKNLDYKIKLLMKFKNLKRAWKKNKLLLKES